MSGIFKRFPGSAFLLFGLLALLCAMPASPARAGGTEDTPGPCPPPGRQSCSPNSIILPFRNLYEKVTDFTTAGQNPLAVTRHYNSEAGGLHGSFSNWSWTYDRELGIGATEVDAVRADGKLIEFFPDGSGGWKITNADTDIDLRLTQTGSTWTLTDWDDNVETYMVMSGMFGSFGALQSIKARGGYTQTMHYTPNANPFLPPLLTSVTDSYGRTLTITYDDLGDVGCTCIGSITTPDGLVLTYSYSIIGQAVLTKVSYSTTPATSLTYLYAGSGFSGLPPLTGIIDENGNRFATWAYEADPAGEALPTSSQLAGGADLTTVAYDSLTVRGNATVTSALGEQDVYKVPFDGATKITEIDRVAPAAARTFTYDSNGYFASETDWNGNLTSYVNNRRGLPKAITEAAGTPLARTTNIGWHPVFHLPVQITEPNRTTAFTYDANGNLLTKQITAGAATRTFAYTYNATGQVLTETDPRGNVTNYAYDARGNLTSVTDALGHVTSIPSYDGAGRPLTIIDPNGVTTSLTYTRRGHLRSQTIGTLKTSYAYDKAGNLVQVTQPDGSSLTYTYDQAHRLTGIADSVGDHIAYTLDAAGNTVNKQAFDPSGMLRQTRSYAYNALNRLKRTIGAQGQTTVYDYDKQGNPTAVIDPLNLTTTYAYDALNRLAEAIDPKGGTTFYGYDANDHLTSVTDPRALKTAYGWDGLDDQTAIASPDTGATAKTFDAAGNVITSTDSRGNTTTYSYDALNRRTGAAFADGTSTAWQYDQGANGIGRLSKITDVTGSTSYSYDANGHVTQKVQTIGAVTRTMTYGYDAGGRLASLTYPSGRQVAYAYDAAGRVSSIKTGGGGTIVAGVTYFPFGRAAGWTEGNGATYQRTIDQDGRITGLALPAGGNIALSYDAASRITGRAETGFAAESFAYNKLGSLHIYASGGATKTYTYDADSNRTSYLDNAAPPVSLTYNIDPASNRLASISGSSTESFTYDATGNMLSYSAPFADYSFSYDARNRQTQAFVGAIGTGWLINGRGQRVAQINASVPEFFFVYDEAGHLAGKYDGGGNPLQETVWLGDLPVAVLLSPAGRSYIAPDHLGSPHQITGANGVVVWLWHPDPFGNGDPTGAFTYDLRFPGQFFDQATKLHYNYFRDYDPRLGRYIESDPIGLASGVNTYAYAKGNPLRRIDPSGLGGITIGPISIGPITIGPIPITIGRPPAGPGTNPPDVGPGTNPQDAGSGFPNLGDAQALGQAEYIQALNDAYDRLKEKLWNLDICDDQEREDLERQLRILADQIAIASDELNQTQNPFEPVGPTFPGNPF